MNSYDQKTTYIRELKKQMIYEMQTNKRNGVYGFIQQTIAYNSNRIEGSTLTPEQTASMFEMGTITSKDEIIRDDNKARCFKCLHDAQIYDNISSLIEYLKEEQDCLYEQTKGFVLPYNHLL